MSHLSDKLHEKYDDQVTDCHLRLEQSLPRLVSPFARESPSGVASSASTSTTVIDKVNQLLKRKKSAIGGRKGGDFSRTSVEDRHRSDEISVVVVERDVDLVGMIKSAIRDVDCGVLDVRKLGLKTWPETEVGGSDLDSINEIGSVLISCVLLGVLLVCTYYRL